MSQWDEDLKLLDESDEFCNCPTHVGYDGEKRPTELCVGCWNIYLFKLTLKQLKYAEKLS